MGTIGIIFKYYLTWNSWSLKWTVIVRFSFTFHTFLHAFSKTTCLSLTEMCFYSKDHQENKSLLDTNKAQQVLDQGEYKDTDLQRLHTFLVLFLVFLHYKNLSNNQTEWIHTHSTTTYLLNCIIHAVIALLVLIYRWYVQPLTSLWVHN